MRFIWLLFLLPCLMFSQPVDTVGISPKAKEVTEKILLDNHVFETKSEELNKELQKQVELMRQIKIKISKFKTVSNFSNDSNIKNVTYLVKKSRDSVAVKSEDTYIEYNGKRVLWDARPRTWFGKIFNEEDMVYYPYIISDDGKPIYIKL